MMKDICQKKGDIVSNGKDQQESYIKEMKDIRDGLSLRREINLAARIARECEETDKNVIINLDWRTK